MSLLVGWTPVDYKLNLLLHFLWVPIKLMCLFITGYLRT